MLLGARTGAWAKSGGIDPFLGHNVIKITVPDGGGTFYITNFDSENKDSRVDWGDGTTSLHRGIGSTYNFATHNYVAGGDYTITIGDDVREFGCSGLRSETTTSRNWVTEVWGKWLSRYQYRHFDSCINLIAAHGYPIVCPTFEGCSSLVSAPSFEYMTGRFHEASFRNCTSLSEISKMPYAASNNYVFMGCSALSSGVVAPSFNNLNQRLFSGCRLLPSISVGVIESCGYAWGQNAGVDKTADVDGIKLTVTVGNTMDSLMEMSNWDGDVPKATTKFVCADGWIRWENGVWTKHESNT